MSWTTFPTLTDGQVLTGAHMQLVRDNFAETAPAKATTAGRIFVATGANAIAERAVSSAIVATTAQTTSVSYTDLSTGAVGPAVTVTTGANAIVFASSRISNSVGSTFTAFAVAVSGATTIAASDTEGLLDFAGGGRYTMVNHFAGTLTPGSNTFTMKYRCSAGTGTFLDRKLTVIAL